MNKRLHVIDATFCCLGCSDGMDGYVYREHRVDLDEWMAGMVSVKCGGCGGDMYLSDDWGGVDYMVARDEVFARLGWERRGKNLYFKQHVQRQSKRTVLQEATELLSELPKSVQGREGTGGEEV